jgi:hypothetical protein
MLKNPLEIGANAVPATLAASLPPDTLLTRRQLAAESSKLGFPVAESSLASMASRGTGPAFVKYTVGRSTAEHRAKAAA